MTRNPGPAALVRPEILAGSPYRVQPVGDAIKLDAMEAPEGLPAELHAAWQEAVTAVAWNRYPDGSGAQLKERLVAHFGGGGPEHLLLGNGSDEIIQMLAQALARPGARMLTVEPGFGIYAIAARTAGMTYTAVDLAPEDFRLDRQRLWEAVERERPALVFIANPNNPTGNCFPRELLLELAEAVPGLVVVDEAYFPYTEASLLDRAGRPANLAVLRTLSKAGMAGLRLGWLTAAPDWIDALERVRMPYNINALSQAAAVFALDHPDWWRELTGNIRREREGLKAALAEIPQVTVWPSEANFLLVRVADAPAVHAGLRERGVLVKLLEGQHPTLAGCLRLTVGTASENRLLLDALNASLAEAAGQATR